MKTYSEKTAAIDAVIREPFLTTSKEDKEKSADIESKIFNGSNSQRAEGYAEFYKSVNSYFSLLTRAVHGMDLEGRELPKHIQDRAGRIYTEKSLGMFKPQTIAIFQNAVDELQIDTAWMRVFDMVNVTGTDEAKIVDIDDSKSDWQEYARQKDIQLSDFGELTFSKLEKARFAYGKGMERSWLSQNMVWNINRIMQMFGIKNLKFKASRAYTAINAAPATTTTISANTLDARVQGFDDGYVTLLRRLEGNGFNVSGSTPVLAFHRPEYTGLVNLILNRRQGAETNNSVVSWPISSVPTFNTNLDLTKGGKKYVIFVYPGAKNIWANFDSMRSETKEDFGTDTLMVRAQEYFNHQVNAEQFEIVNLEN